MSRRTLTALSIAAAVILVVPAFGAYASWITGQHAQAALNVVMFIGIAACSVIMWVCRPPKGGNR